MKPCLSICLMSLLFFTCLAPVTINATDRPSIPSEAQAEDVSQPDHVIGTGTPESCTPEAFIDAVAQGGIIVFNGGDDPFTITLPEQAVIYNDAAEKTVIDGGGIVTLSGGGRNRILYMNTCDPDLHWTTSHCQNQDHPQLTVQNLTFTEGNASSDDTYTGGGAIWVRGGRFKAVNCTFTSNVCQTQGPDVGGGALRVFSQYSGEPVYLVNCVFGGGETLGNIGANGGAISSIGVSWTIIDCLFSHNQAVGNGGNPAKSGTPGGGSGGAIYNDGNDMTLTLIDTVITNNRVNAYGSGIFFVTNNRTGDIQLFDSVIEGNHGGSWYPVYPEISMHSDTEVTVLNTTTAIKSIATPTASEVFINGEPVRFDAYLIDDNNYFKLRDLAYVLNGTSKNFSIQWHPDTAMIVLESQSPYDTVGGEMSIKPQPTERLCKWQEPNIEADGETIVLKAYLIDGNNYFKLRDIAILFDFGVSWNGELNRVVIDTEQPYRAP